MSRRLSRRSFTSLGVLCSCYIGPHRRHPAIFRGKDHVFGPRCPASHRASWSKQFVSLGCCGQSSISSYEDFLLTHRHQLLALLSDIGASPSAHSIQKYRCCIRGYYQSHRKVPETYSCHKQPVKMCLRRGPPGSKCRDRCGEVSSMLHEAQLSFLNAYDRPATAAVMALADQFPGVAFPV